MPMMDRSLEKPPTNPDERSASGETSYQASYLQKGYTNVRGLGTSTPQCSA